MLTRRHFSQRVAAVAMMITLVLANTPAASAQDDKSSSAFADVVKGVVLDPTTYAPALIGYDATMRDWNTSQPFFRNGFVEHNQRFTLTNAEIGRRLGIYQGHIGHEGHISRTVLGLLENEEVIVQDKQTKTWRLREAKSE